VGKAYQVGEYVSGLAFHQPAGTGEARDELHVGLQQGRVGLQHDVDQRRKEVISTCWPIFGLLDDLEDVLAAPHYAG